MRYINFYPGNMQEDFSLTVDETPAYGMAVDLVDFIECMTVLNCSITYPVEGVKDALNDGEFLGRIVNNVGLTEGYAKFAAEEICAVIG